MSHLVGISTRELSLFEDSVQLTGRLPGVDSNAVAADIELQLQACSDEICLAPETLTFKVPLTPVNRSY